MAAFGSKLKHAGWRHKPSWAIIPTDDKAFDNRMLHKMAKRIGAETVEVKASHAVMTQLEAVAEVIKRAAGDAGTRRGTGS